MRRKTRAECVRTICRERAMSHLGPVVVQLTDVPIPEDTQGPFGMTMCLSPDGEQLAVTGGVVAPPALRNPGDILGRLLRGVHLASVAFFAPSLTFRCRIG